MSVRGFNGRGYYLVYNPFISSRDIQYITNSSTFNGKLKIGYKSLLFLGSFWENEFYSYLKMIKE